MATVTELIFEEQIGHLREIAENRGWELKETEDLGFILTLQAKDGSRYSLKVECEGYQSIPPAWHWYNLISGIKDQRADTPKGTGGYFHDCGRICASWNRLAYKSVDPVGPHGEWELNNWMTNPHSKGCTTLSAMAVRMATELGSDRYLGRAA